MAGVVAAMRSARGFLAVAVALALTFVGPSRAPDRAFADDEPAPTLREDLRRLRERRLGRADAQWLRTRAAQAGPVRLSGRHRLSGAVFAETLVVERGSDVVVAAGTTIYVRGDVVIDAPVIAEAPRGGDGPRPGRVGGKRPVTVKGGDGSDNVDIVFICEQGSFTQNEPLLGGDGGDGESLTIVDAADGDVYEGGDGGKGVGFVIDCPDGTVTIRANIVPGRGGAGGFANVSGRAGDPQTGGDGANVVAYGGRGGDSGDIRIVADSIVFDVDDQDEAVGRLGIRAGGVGGRGEARGGDGADAPACGQRGGRGGFAEAEGGAGGTSTIGVLEARLLLPETLQGDDIVSFEDVSEFPDGGNATARGGDGGAGGGCPGISLSCPDVGRNGGAGGRAGAGISTGGDGGFGGRIAAGKGSALLSRIRQNGAEARHGWGGAATSVGGSGGAGGRGGAGARPGRGGRGGAGGLGDALGGFGADTSLASKKRIGFNLEPGLAEPGRGGDATATGGSPGTGGNGGDCCGGPLRSGGQGGGAGAIGRVIAEGGRGGRGRGGVFGPNGLDMAFPAMPGVAGIPGAACGELGVPGVNGGLATPNLLVRGQIGVVALTVRNDSGSGIESLSVALNLGGDLIHSAVVDLAMGQEIEIPVDFAVPNGPKAVFDVVVNDQRVQRVTVKTQKSGGGGGCAEVLEGVPQARVLFRVLQGETVIRDGDTLGSIPRATALSMDAVLVAEMGATLTDVSIEVRIGATVVFETTVPGPVSGFQVIPAQGFTLPAGTDGCLEIRVNGVVDERYTVPMTGP